MIEIIFFRNLSKLMDKYYLNPSNINRTNILVIFVDLKYSISSMKLINYALEHDYDMFQEFIGFLAFNNGINFNDLKQFSDFELYYLDGLIFNDNELAYDSWELFEEYKKITKKYDIK